MTVITEIIGLVVGLVAGYYGGVIDSIIMRIVDFVQILPQFPIIIVLTTVIPNYNAVTLVWLMSMFYWTTTVTPYATFLMMRFASFIRTSVVEIFPTDTVRLVPAGTGISVSALTF